jgi:hypothetical protein
MSVLGRTVSRHKWFHDVLCHGRVGLSSHAGGTRLTAVSDEDDIGNDAIDETLHLAYVDSMDHPAGLFATVIFDPIGETPPTAADFACEVSSASDSGGQTISNVGCSVAIAP